MEKFNIGDEVVCISSFGNFRKGKKYIIRTMMSNSIFEQRLGFNEYPSFVSSTKFISIVESRRRKLLKLKDKINGLRNRTESSLGE